MNKKLTLTILSVLFILCASLGYLIWITSSQPVSGPKQKFVQYNFCVLIDLSDRIDKIRYPNQVQKDIAIIKNIISIFHEQVKKNLYVNSKDKIQIIVAPQPVPYVSTLHKIADRLRIDMSEFKNPRDKRVKLQSMEDSLLSGIDILYRKATQNPRFLGADIWGFFKDDIDNYIINSSEDSVKNIFIILTDGYIQFEKEILSSRPPRGNRTSYMLVNEFLNDPNWHIRFDLEDHGLIPINKNYKNVEVLVLEVRPNNILNPVEYDIIKKYWYKWFDEMGIRKRNIQKTQDSAAQVKKLIKDFIISDSNSSYNVFTKSTQLDTNLVVPNIRLQDNLNTGIPLEQKTDIESTAIDHSYKEKTQLHSEKIEVSGTEDQKIYLATQDQFDSVLVRSIAVIAYEFDISKETISEALKIPNRPIEEKQAVFDLIINHDPISIDSDLESTWLAWLHFTRQSKYQGSPANQFIKEVANKIYEKYQWSRQKKEYVK